MSAKDRVNGRAMAAPEGGYAEIHRSAVGFVNVIFNFALEHFGELVLARLQTQQYNGAGRSGITRNAFAWPLQGDQPVDAVLTLVDDILAAARHQGEPDDERGTLRRFHDRLVGRQLIQHITQLARVDTPVPRRLRVDVYRQRQRVFVLLHHDVSRGATTTLRLPIEAVTAWRDWLIRQKHEVAAG